MSIGFEVVAYVGGHHDQRFRTPVNCEKIVGSWAPTYREAIAEKRRLEEKYDALVELV